MKRYTGAKCARKAASNPASSAMPGREGLLWPGDHASEQEKQAWRDRCAEYYRKEREQPALS